MSTSGPHPYQDDDAAYVASLLRARLQDAFDVLRREDPIDVDTEQRLLALLPIVHAIEESTTHLCLRDEDADELCALAEAKLSPSAADAVIGALDPAHPIPVRGGFRDEARAEAWLRELGLPYEIWMNAAGTGDDFAAAWNTIARLTGRYAVARAMGISAEEVIAAIASAIAALATVQLANAPRAAAALEELAQRGALPPALADELADATDPLAELVEKLDRNPRYLMLVIDHGRDGTGLPDLAATISDALSWVVLPRLPLPTV